MLYIFIHTRYERIESGICSAKVEYLRLIGTYCLNILWRVSMLAPFVCAVDAKILRVANRYIRRKLIAIKITPTTLPPLLFPFSNILQYAPYLRQIEMEKSTNLTNYQLINYVLFECFIFFFHSSLLTFYPHFQFVHLLSLLMRLLVCLQLSVASASNSCIFIRSL